MELKKEDERPVTLIDYDEGRDQWLAICGDPGCPNRGEFARSDHGTPEDHDMVWLTAVLHEEFFHDGDGRMDVDDLISLRPYPVPNPSWKAAASGD